MDAEAQIAEQLKQNIPKQDSAPAPAQDTPDLSTQGYTADLGDVPEIYKMYDFFGIETNYRTSENERKIQEIYRWSADLAQSTDYLTVIKTIMDYEQAMGNSAFGSRLERMYQYVKLDQQIKKLKLQQSWL